MIQRIQTVYLFALFAIGLILIWQDPVYASFQGSKDPSSYVLMFWNSYAGSAPVGINTVPERCPNVISNGVNYGADWMTIVVSLSAMSVSILSIFFFKNRKFQLKMVLGATLWTCRFCGIIGHSIDLAWVDGDFGLYGISRCEGRRGDGSQHGPHTVRIDEKTGIIGFVFWVEQRYVVGSAQIWEESGICRGGRSG